MGLKAEQHVINSLTGSVRKIFEVMNDDEFMTGQEIMADLQRVGINLSVSSVDKICLDLVERGLAERRNGRKAEFRRAKVKVKSEPASAEDEPDNKNLHADETTVRELPRERRATKVANLEDRCLAAFTDLVEKCRELEQENAELKQSTCTPEEMARLREADEELRLMKKILGRQ